LTHITPTTEYILHIAPSISTSSRIALTTQYVLAHCTFNKHIVARRTYNSIHQSSSLPHLVRRDTSLLQLNTSLHTALSTSTSLRTEHTSNHIMHIALASYTSSHAVV
jgi:hypothetical protein